MLLSRGDREAVIVPTVATFSTVVYVTALRSRVELSVSKINELLDTKQSDVRRQLFIIRV